MVDIDAPERNMTPYPPARAPEKRSSKPIAGSS
jgi:hypothetical protein